MVSFLNCYNKMSLKTWKQKVESKPGAKLRIARLKKKARILMSKKSKKVEKVSSFRQYLNNVERNDKRVIDYFKKIAKKYKLQVKQDHYDNERECYYDISYNYDFSVSGNVDGTQVSILIMLKNEFVVRSFNDMDGNVEMQDIINCHPNILYDFLTRVNNFIAEINQTNIVDIINNKIL